MNSLKCFRGVSCLLTVASGLHYSVPNSVSVSLYLAYCASTAETPVSVSVCCPCSRTGSQVVHFSPGIGIVATSWAGSGLQLIARVVSIQGVRGSILATTHACLWLLA